LVPDQESAICLTGQASVQRLTSIAPGFSRTGLATRGFQLASSEIGTSPIPVGAGKADRFALLLVVVLLLAYQPAWHGTPIFDDAMRLPKPQGNSVAALIEVWLRPSITHQYHPL